MGDSPEFPSTVNNPKAIEITGKIMVIAIIVLFIVVVVVLFLHLYARWFWWRVVEEPSLQEHNQSLRRRRRRFVFVPGQDNDVLVRRGLDPAVLRSIPVVVYRQEDFEEGLECAVCLCDVAEGEKARILPKCSHGFHVECIDMWFQSHTTCPLCRNSVTSEYNVSDSGTGEDLSAWRVRRTRRGFPSRMLWLLISQSTNSSGEMRLGSVRGTDPREERIASIPFPRASRRCHPPLWEVALGQGGRRQW
ncbi:hypothetical protein MLD38_029534 [Melastoma candidum]|uniref:Uncharacterized protein n=1 Tax=Melastoma candidum TaxID=119954 RepID=A0ACB9N4X3_9MYRT|nr:hypothetical protein MLD38_029534 [Melastoma candidum]